MFHQADTHDKAGKPLEKSAFFEIGPGISAGDFPLANEGKIFELSENLTVNEAFHALVKANVLSAPVYSETKKAYLGFLDIMDILALAIGIDLLISVFPTKHDSAQSEAKRTRGEESTQDTVLVSSLFEDGGASLATKWCPVSKDAPFKEILLLLATQTRRVPVIGENGRVVNIVTQSAVVSELYHHILAAGDRAPKTFLMQTPRQTGIGTKKVIAVDEDAPVKEAFMSMIENGVSAVGILDSEHKHLITCISNKDIRLLPIVEQSAVAVTTGSRSVLDTPCRLYAAAVRRAIEKTGKARAAVVCAGLDTPIRLIIGKLAETRMHRVFIVDAQDVPVGVVSVSDILRLLCEQQNWTTGTQ